MLTSHKGHPLTNNFPKISQPSMNKISLKITYLKFHLNLPGANELKRRWTHYMERSPTVLCCRWIPWAASSLSHAAWDRRPHLRGPWRLWPAPNHCTDAKTRLRMRHLMSWASFTNITAEIKVWISNYIHCFMRGVITYPFFNFNGGYNSITIKVRLWMSNYIP